MAVETGRKGEVRAEMRRVLSNLDKRWVEVASRRVCENLNRLIEHDLKKNISNILAFVPYFPGEVDLSSFISSQLGKRRVFLPRTFSDGRLQFAPIDGEWVNSLVSGHFGIPEPGEGMFELFDPVMAPLTAVILPGIAFSEEGARLGRGNGCYDRFFSSAGMDGCERIGVCWNFQVSKGFPMHDHDVPVDWLCHETWGQKTKLLR